MALNDGDKAECKEIAREIINEVIKYHIEMCPHGKTLLMNKYLLMGVCIGCGIASGGVAAAITGFIVECCKAAP